ncbi:MAG TPA: helix-turn-helix domain-containing protein [Capillimicrobium sp.]|nr:helix-turn-helix domain-containing protein [Capillimicrobium sp.]
MAMQLDALARAAAAVGDRWSLVILGALLDGPLRYGELQERVAGISSNVLAQRLTALESAGLVVAEPYSQRPVRLQYAATTAATELAAPLAALAAWGGRHAGDAGEPGLRHELCGTPLEVRWHCPTCDVDVAPAAAADEPGVFRV